MERHLCPAVQTDEHASRIVLVITGPRAGVGHAGGDPGAPPRDQGVGAEPAGAAPDFLGHGGARRGAGL
eukprot:scaffold249698_cov23-Tisochrysis_lutea.AAC.1